MSKFKVSYKFKQNEKDEDIIEFAFAKFCVAYVNQFIKKINYSNNITEIEEDEEGKKIKKKLITLEMDMINFKNIIIVDSKEVKTKKPKPDYQINKPVEKPKNVNKNT